MKINISQLENNKFLSEVEAATANRIVGGDISEIVEKLISEKRSELDIKLSNPSSGALIIDRSGKNGDGVVIS